MRILTVCQHYYPEHFQITDICEELVRRGHEVTVLTGLPNYPEGKIFEGYRHGENRSEQINGVHVLRCHEIGRRPGIVGLSVNYFSYCIPAAVKAFRLKEKYDLVFDYQLSPILMAVPGIVYSKKNKTPLFLYCCDLWPESAKVLLKSGKGLLYGMIRLMSRSVYRRADRVAAQSESFFPYLEEVDGVAREKMRYLPQFADSGYLERTFRLENGVTDFVFLGNIGIAQDIEKIIGAVELIRDVPDFRVHFVGHGSYTEEARALTAQKGLENLIRFHGRQPYEEMPKYYELADVCMATLRGGSVVSQTIPSKVQGYMAAGKPIVAALNGAAKRVIEDAGCGICVSSGDMCGLAEAMRFMIEHPERRQRFGENGRAYFRTHFTKEIFMDKLEEHFREMTENHVIV